MPQGCIEEHKNNTKTKQYKKYVHLLYLLLCIVEQLMCCIILNQSRRLKRNLKNYRFYKIQNKLKINKPSFFSEQLQIRNLKNYCPLKIQKICL